GRVTQNLAGKQAGWQCQKQGAAVGNAALSRRPDWSRKLPRTLVIPDIMTLKALAAVRELLKHLPKGHRERSTWRHVADCLEDAAAGGDTIDVAVPLKMVLSMEGVPYLPQ